MVKPHIPKQYMTACPTDLPDATDGSKIAIQQNHKAQQAQYHDCASDHNALIGALERQGIKGQ